jgi:predicted NBD/HSP70 family sugar kinase
MRATMTMTRRNVNRPRGSQKNPVDQRAVRRHNLGLVMEHISQEGPRSRATIATETGLNKTTVSSLVGELIDRGLLVETETENPGSVGRPAQKVQLSRDVVALGLELAVDYLAVCATDLSGLVRHSAFISRDNRRSSAEDAMQALAHMADEALELIAEQELLPVGVTVALPGIVDIGRGVLFNAPNLGWREVPVVDLLREHLRRPPYPIHVDNESNLGALCELWEGVGSDYQDFIYLLGEVGVGAGIVVGGQLFRGWSGFAGEFGHLPVDPGGDLCGCGSRGCLETIVGQEAVVKRAGFSGHVDTGGVGGVGVGMLLAQEAASGNERVIETLDHVGRTLGLGVSALANLMNPQAIVLGGYFTQVADRIVPAIEKEIARRMIAREWTSFEILVSQLEGQSAVRGAAALSLSEVLSDPELVGDIREGA